MPSEPKHEPRVEDRRTKARLMCAWGDCYWGIESADADDLTTRWRAHSEQHWRRA